MTRKELEEYCNEKGLEFPRFWFWSIGETYRASSAKAEKDCSRWLTELSDGPKNQSKDKYFDEAKKNFPGLSRRGFDSAWDKNVPSTWKKSGRPKKERPRSGRFI